MQVSLCSWEDNGNIYINLSFVLCLLLGHYQWWWHINFSALSWLYTFTNGCTACNCTEIILLNWYYSFAFNTVNLNLLNGHPSPAEGGKKKKSRKSREIFFFFSSGVTTISLLFDFESYCFHLSKHLYFIQVNIQTLT